MPFPKLWTFRVMGCGLHYRVQMLGLGFRLLLCRVSCLYRIVASLRFLVFECWYAQC